MANALVIADKGVVFGDIAPGGDPVSECPDTTGCPPTFNLSVSGVQAQWIDGSSTWPTSCAAQMDNSAGLNWGSGFLQGCDGIGQPPGTTLWEHAATLSCVGLGPVDTPPFVWRAFFLLQARGFGPTIFAVSVAGEVPILTTNLCPSTGSYPITAYVANSNQIILGGSPTLTVS